MAIPYRRPSSKKRKKNKMNNTSPSGPQNTYIPSQAVITNPTPKPWTAQLMDAAAKREAATEAVKQPIGDGCFCKTCKEWYPYAEPNQTDGSLICYSCRKIW